MWIDPSKKKTQSQAIKTNAQHHTFLYKIQIKSTRYYLTLVRIVLIKRVGPNKCLWRWQQVTLCILLVKIKTSADCVANDIDFISINTAISRASEASIQRL